MVLRLLVGIRFQVLFHPPHRSTFHLSLTVLITIGCCRYLALGGGPPCFPRGFSCPAVLGIHSKLLAFSSTGLLPSMTGLSRPLRLKQWFVMSVPLPLNCKQFRFWLVPFRSPLLGESLLLSFPQGTKMFQFPWCPPITYVFSYR